MRLVQVVPILAVCVALVVSISIENELSERKKGKGKKAGKKPIKPPKGKGAGGKGTKPGGKGNGSGGNGTSSGDDWPAVWELFGQLKTLLKELEASGTAPPDGSFVIVLDNGTHKQMYEDLSGIMVPQYMTFTSSNSKGKDTVVKFDVPAHENLQDLTVVMHTDNDGIWHGTKLKNNMLMKLGSICHILDLPSDISPEEIAVNFVRQEQRKEPVKAKDQIIKYTSLINTDERLNTDKLHPDIQNICRGLKIVKSKRVVRKVPLKTEFQLEITDVGKTSSSCCSLETATTYDEGCIKWPNPAGGIVNTIHEIVSAGVDLTSCMDNTATNPGCSPSFPGCCQCHCRCTDIADKHDFSECLGRPEIPRRKRLTQTLLDNLSDGERNNLVSALVDMRADISQHGFDHVLAFHGDPLPGQTALCPTGSCCPHASSPDFVAWHRLYIVNFDTGLRRHKHAARLPYWDWTTPMSDLPDLVKDATIIDPVNPATTIPNPFFHGARNVQPDLLELTNPPSLSLLQRVLDALDNNLSQFINDFNGGVHADIHVWVGGGVSGSMNFIGSAATDPIFYLHHSMCDLIWAVYQYLNSNDPSSTANLAPFHEPSKNPNHITLQNSNIDGALDYENDLCYTYNLNIGSSDVVFGGLTLQQIDDEVMLLKQQDRYYAGLFLRNYHTSAIIKFNMCYPNIITFLQGKETARKANLGKPTYRCVPGGKLSIFGGPNQIPYINDVVTKISITHLMKKYNIIDKLDSMSGGFNDIKFEVTEIITAKGKQEQISKDMVFTPVNILREKNTGRDSMGIHFGDGSNNPPKIRVVDGTHITFITKSKNIIYKANDKEAFEKCDIHQATPIPHVDGFLPQLGYNFYFATNKVIGNCQSNSKLIIYVSSSKNNMAGKNPDAL